MRLHNLSIDVDTQDPEADVLRRVELQSKLRIYTQQLIEEAAERRNPSNLGRLYYAIGLVHDEMERLAEAETYFRAAAHSFELVDELVQAAQAWLQVGELQAYLFFLNPAEAFERSRRAAKRAGHGLLQAQAIHHLGRLKQEQGDFEGALADYEAALYFVTPAETSEDASAAAVLQRYILEGIAAVELEQLLQRAKEIAERTNRDAERPDSAPGDPGDVPAPRSPFPAEPRSSQGSRFWWWRRGR